MLDRVPKDRLDWCVETTADDTFLDEFPAVTGIGDEGLGLTGDETPGELRPLEKFLPSSGFTIDRCPVGEVTSEGDDLLLEGCMFPTITEEDSSGESFDSALCAIYR